LTADTDLLQAPIPRETTEHIETAQILLAQKTAKYQGISETIALVFKEHVERHDPLRKAQRAQTENQHKHIRPHNLLHVQKIGV